MSLAKVQPKVVCVGLNKTATKSLAKCFVALGYRNESYSKSAFTLYQQQDWSSLFAHMEKFDTFEDWPWPLMYREIDKKFPDTKFILTTRSSPQRWYRSLCKMAVRMGPLNTFEKHIYGYPMPQGHKKEHISFYNRHNSEVRAYFANTNDKLLEICFDDGVSMRELTHFLGLPDSQFSPPHSNKSENVYSGDSLWRAHIHRIIFQSKWHTKKFFNKFKNFFLR